MSGLNPFLLFALLMAACTTFCASSPMHPKLTAQEPRFKPFLTTSYQYASPTRIPDPFRPAAVVAYVYGSHNGWLPAILQQLRETLQVSGTPVSRIDSRWLSESRPCSAKRWRHVLQLTYQPWESRFESVTSTALRHTHPKSDQKIAYTRNLLGEFMTTEQIFTVRTMLGMEIRGAGEPIVLDEEEYNAWTPGHRVTHFDSLPNVRRIYIANAFIDSSLHGYDQTPLTAGQWAYLENELIVKPNPERLMYFNPRDLETIERTDENRNAFFELIAYAGEQVLEDAINAVKARHDLWKPVRLW